MTTAALLRLHLGCGDNILPGYLNVDLYNPKADARDDVSRLDGYEPGSVGEIRAELVLEHLGYEDGRRALRHWRELLCRGGKLDLVVPDILFSIRRWLAAYESDDPSWHDYHYHLWGLQTAEGQYHRWGFTERSLTRALADAGFAQIVLSRPFGPHSIRAEAWKA